MLTPSPESPVLGYGASDVLEAGTEHFDASLPGSVVAVPPIWTNEDGRRLNKRP